MNEGRLKCAILNMSHQFHSFRIDVTQEIIFPSLLYGHESNFLPNFISCIRQFKPQMFKNHNARKCDIKPSKGRMELRISVVESLLIPQWRAIIKGG